MKSIKLRALLVVFDEILMRLSEKEMKLRSLDGRSQGFVVSAMTPSLFTLSSVKDSLVAFTRGANARGVKRV